MVGQRYLLIAAAVVSTHLSARAADPATPAPSAPAGSSANADSEIIRRTFESLTPEQRQRFKENFQRWLSLSPAEKKDLREREEIRRMRIAEETEKAIKDLGLQMTPAEHDRFVQRYTEERRVIEQKLMESRKPLMREMMARLRQEFGVKKEPSIPLEKEAPPGP